MVTVTLSPGCGEGGSIVMAPRSSPCHSTLTETGRERCPSGASAFTFQVPGSGSTIFSASTGPVPPASSNCDFLYVPCVGTLSPLGS